MWISHSGTSLNSPTLYGGTENLECVYSLLQHHAGPNLALLILAVYELADQCQPCSYGMGMIFPEEGLMVKHMYWVQYKTLSCTWTLIVMTILARYKCSQRLTPTGRPQNHHSPEPNWFQQCHNRGGLHGDHCCE